MKHAILCLGLLLSFTVSSSASALGRMTPLAYSKAQIAAVLTQIDTNNLLISAISLHDDGKVKMHFVSPSDKTCRAVIFTTALSSDGSMRVLNQQRAACNHR